MKNILNIGHTDLRLFFNFKSKGIYLLFWMFILPVVFVYFSGMATRGLRKSSYSQPPVLVKNDDTNFLGRFFVAEMGAQQMKILTPTNGASAVALVQIPRDFTSKLLQGERSNVQFVKYDNATEADATVIQLHLTRTLIAMNGHILEAVAQTNALGTLVEGKLADVQARHDPISLCVSFAGHRPVPSGYNFSLPANLVMYVILNLLVCGGATMAAERQNGVLKRLSACPITQGEIVIGKIYGLMLLAVVQIAYFLLLGKFVYHINLGTALPAVALTSLLFAWVAASLGVLAGSVTIADDRISGICVLVSLVMAALGGCWFPLELCPPVLKTIAYCLPTGWALQSLNQLISFGSDLHAIIKPLLALLTFGCVANFLAIRFFRI